MPSDSPNSVLAFEDFLKRAGFACQQQLDSQVFGNRLLECRSVDFVVQIVLDRSTWFIGLSELSEPGTTYYAEMLKQLLSGEQEETMPISEQIDFFQKNWPAIMALLSPNIEITPEQDTRLWAGREFAGCFRAWKKRSNSQIWRIQRSLIPTPRSRESSLSG